MLNGEIDLKKLIQTKLKKTIKDKMEKSLNNI